MNIRRAVNAAKRKIWKSSRPSLNGLDRKLQNYLDFDNGFYVEAGANDGYSQSNTYFLENSKGWGGLLIEGIPELYTRCVQERPGSKVVNSALVDSDFPNPTITMHYAGLMSTVDLALREEGAQTRHIERGLELQHIDQGYSVDVNAETLESVLDREAKDRKIDFFSLDVEGYELSVLSGMNLDRYRPRFILVEAKFFDEVNALLCRKGYKCLEKMTHHDYLYGCESNCA